MKVYKLLSLFSLIITINSYAQDTINWRANYKLKWQDFQGKPDTNSIYSAVSNPVIKYKLRADEDGFNVEVFCYLIKGNSWARYKTNDTLLKHEQGHFDIAELFARKLRKLFSEYKFNYKTVGTDIEKIFVVNKKERTRVDLLYDKETNFSKNSKKQFYWNNKIKAELLKLKKYSLN